MNPWLTLVRAGALVGAVMLADPFSALAQDAFVEVEGGVVFSGRNDARIPGDSGTTFSLTDDLSTSPEPVFRLRAGVRIADRHVISALYAPLTVTARGSVDRDIDFQGETYPAGSSLLAVYRFNSYRLTYRYSFLRRQDLELAAGFTGKIRDAETALYGPASSRKTNIGFVPLLKFHGRYRPGGGDFGVVVDIDGLAAPQGRAIDALVAATWQVRDGIGLRLGYRTLEGGADNDEVYSFAWFHYLVAGLDVEF